MSLPTLSISQTKASLVAGVGALVLWTGSAAAQAPGQTTPPGSDFRGFQPESSEPTDEAPPSVKSVCAVGRRGPRCASIVLFELGFRGGSMPTSTLDVGVLINQGEDQAWGATIGLLGFEGQNGWAGKARYRRWLGDFVGLDVGVGAGSWGPAYGDKQLNVTAEVALELGDIVAFTTGAHSYAPEISSGDRVVAATAGVRLGSYPTLVVLRFLAAIAGGR